jgi:N-formylglutamate deformylase
VPPEEDAAFGKSQRQDGAKAPTYRGFFFAPERGIMPKQNSHSISHFTVLPGDRQSRVIIHVPHAGSHIPKSELATFELRGAELDTEAQLMADTNTDLLALKVYEEAELKPWVFINNLSRLVVDPERFTDASEEMNAVGMGFAYEKTSDQRPLRSVNKELSRRQIETYFQPYSDAFSTLTSEIFIRNESVTIIDLHAYAVEALPYELHKKAKRPGLCIGTDRFHTSGDLISEVESQFEDFTSVARNAPFSGSYVPLPFYEQNSSIKSIMLEIRKDTYGFGDPSTEGFERVTTAITNLVDRLSPQPIIEIYFERDQFEVECERDLRNDQWRAISSDIECELYGFFETLLKKYRAAVESGKYEQIEPEVIPERISI